MSGVIKSTMAGFVLLVGGYYTLSAQVIHIPDDRTTIQAGINAASDGDTILIDEGQYFENINFLGKAITVASRYLVDGDTSHISKTIIDGSRPANPDSASVVTLWSGEDTTSILCGLTIQGGRGTLVDSIHGSTLPEMIREKYVAGGGVLIYNSGGKIVNNIITQNQISGIIKGVRGGLGAGILAAVNHHHQVAIRHNTIADNSMEQRHGHGGGIGLHGGPAVVEHNQIRGNLIEVRGMAAGGGIFFENEGVEGSIPNAVIRNNVISDNILNTMYDVGGGGGISVAATLISGEVQISHNLISGNVADIGGGISGWNSKSLLRGNMFLGNKALMREDDVGSEAENTFYVDRNLYCPQDYWIASCKGIHKFRPGGVLAMNFEPGRGIQITPWQTQFSIDQSTGEIHIGELYGMVSFDPRNVPVNMFVNHSVFLDFNACMELSSGEQGIPDIRDKRNHLRLDVPVKQYNINFSSASFQYDRDHLPNRKYQFLLFERDPDTTLEYRAFTEEFANFKARRYHFWASQQDTLELEEPVEMFFTIHVHAPWYRRWWALMTYMLFLLLLVAVSVRIRTARLKKEKIALEKEVEKRTAELRQKNEHIMEMERLKTRFFTDVSHEIRTPLNLITGPLDKLARMDHPDPRTREWLTVILRNSQRLLQLVNQLLDISRLESGKMKLVLEHSNLIRHLKVLVSQYSSLAYSRHIRFVIDIPDEELIAWYDREKLTKITHNLLSNAFKFTPVKGVVTCRVRIRNLPGGSGPIRYSLRLIVADTGAGIPMKEREKIFTRFYRSHHPGLEDAGGTGIGLALTRELVQLMHGEVAVKSLEGKGSVFIVSFPLGKDHLKEEEYVLKEPDPVGTRLEEEPLAAAGRAVIDIPDEEKQEILVVEDNSDLRKFIRESLSPEFRVIEASDGMEGLELAFAHLPDMVITDVMMPGIDGMELCASLKGETKTSHIPVIMLTARATKSDRREGLEMGADDYLIKPFEMEELMIRIRNLLEQRKKLRQKFSAMIHMDWSSLKVTTLDEQFLKRLTRFIKEHIDDFDLNVNTLKDEMAMSREHLFRKVKALTGDSPSGLLQTMRMKAAAEMLIKSRESITRIALNTGYSSPSYFTKIFRKHFGTSPQEYRKRKMIQEEDR